MAESTSFPPEDLAEVSEENPEYSHLDNEWHARNTRRRRSDRSPWRKPVFIFSLILINLLVGLLGGVTGFVALSNSDATWARELRRVLQLDTAELRVPVRQELRLQESTAIIDAAKKVSPAVVAVTANAQVADFFTGNITTQEIGGGSGFIITSDGLIVTNKHVVENEASYKAILSDGRILDAKVQAIDPFNDLAVLKVDARDLPTVELGSSDSLEIGQLVVAVGNAFNEFRNSVTLGVVSAKGRSLSSISGSTGGEQLSDLIQTDAAINPGNSGGPLVNMAGQVVGINSAIASTSQSSAGVGFAIAIDSIRNVIESVRKTGEIVRPYLGIRYRPITKALQTANSLPVDYGIIVSRTQNPLEFAVVPGSPADKAGIVENDIILEINGERIDQEHSLIQRLQRYNVGDEITLKILRRGEEQSLKVTLEKAPQ